MALDDPHPGPGCEPPSDSAGQAAAGLFPEAELLAGDELLPCGRPLSHAWEQARDTAGTADPHTPFCPYCRQASKDWRPWMRPPALCAP
ncbi:hypothetical protein [Streptomyces xanthochromogenes]|uniref:hypothetical protein n=1 Tax=Streptomyces xanthochromogenes TaxID=67384 RepID=UPI0034281941